MRRKYVTTNLAQVTPDGMIVPQTATRDILEETKYYYDEIEKLTKQRDKLYEEQSKLKVGTSDFDNNTKEVSRLDDQLSTLTDNFTKNIGIIDSAYKSLFNSDGDVLAGYSALARNVEAFYTAIADKEYEGIITHNELMNSEVDIAIRIVKDVYE